MTSEGILEVLSAALAMECKDQNIGYVLILMDEDDGQNVAAHAASNVPPEILVHTLRHYPQDRRGDGREAMRLLAAILWALVIFLAFYSLGAGMPT